MWNGYESLKALAGYDARIFARMLSEHGALDTARRLLRGAVHTYGLDTLALKGRLDMSVENSVLKPEFDPLFSDEERDLARRRLSAYGYDV